MDMLKQLRQLQIQQIIERRPIRTQQELVGALAEQGIRATQATVSRDIAELGLRKQIRDGLPAYVAADGAVTVEVGAEDRLRDLLSNMPVEIRVAGLLLVMRGVPGSAHAIAAALDRLRWAEVAGSIGGDDTVFVAFETRAALDAVARRLRRMAEG